MNENIDSEFESLLDGRGWRVAVHQAMYELESLGSSFWKEEARGLGALLEQVPAVGRLSATREQLVHEAMILGQVGHHLSHIFNADKANLSQPQRDRLQAHVVLAMNEVREQEKAIPAAIADNERDVAKVNKFIDTKSKLEQDATLAGPTGQPPGSNRNELRIDSGGFAYGIEFFPLHGRPFQMLTALLASRHHRLAADDLRKAMGIDDLTVEYPEQVVKDTAKSLRRALRKAIKSAGLDCPDPLPSDGQGADLAYALAMPEN